MSTPAWGSKHLCPDCGIKFYDLKKDVVACPKCGTTPPAAPVRRAAAPKARRVPFSRTPIKASGA